MTIFETKKLTALIQAARKFVPLFDTDFNTSDELALSRSIRDIEALAQYNEVEDKLSAELLFKADLFDYVCWLHSQDPLGMQAEHKCGDALVFASDGTTIWAKTYADAFKVAMQHDKEIFDAQHTKSP